MGRISFKSIVRIVLFLLGVFLIKFFLFQPFFMFDSGMEPTLKENRIYFINKSIYHLRKPGRGEILFFRTTDDPPLFFVSRVVALPGETLEIREGKVLINEKALREDYAKTNSNWNLEKLKIKKNCFYILGDNRQMSLANHLHAQVAKKNILGKIKIKKR